MGSIPIVGLDCFQNPSRLLVCRLASPWDEPDDRLVARLVNMGSYPSGQRGLTVNQLAKAFGGSNPSLPTSALIAQSVEHILGKNGVMGSNPIEGFATS